MRLGALVNVLPRMTRCGWPRRSARSTSSPAAGSTSASARVSPYDAGLPRCARRPGQGDLRRVPGRAHRRLRTGRLDHRGTLLRDYDATLSVLPRQRPYPPLWYASSNTKTARWAGEHGVNFVGGERRHAGRRRRGVLGRLGRQPRRRDRLNGHVADPGSGWRPPW